MNIILFDEVEKMHPKTIQSLLSMLDEGFVVLKNNETLDCRNSLIFFTSNVGESDAQQVATAVGFGNQNHTTQEKQQAIKEKIFEKTFSPEFRGRLDNIIEFEPLEKNFLDILLNKYKKDLIDDVLYLSGNKLLIEYDEQINDHIKNQIQEDKGYRNVHRIRQNLVQNELGSVIKIEKLLREKKHQILHVLVENNELIYELEQKKSLNHPTTKDDTTLIDIIKKDDDHPNNPRPDQ